MNMNIYLPINTDPAISKIVAKMQAWTIVRTFDPTLVPNEFATSLAPMPNAKMKAMIKDTTIIHNIAEEYGSIILKIPV